MADINEDRMNVEIRKFLKVVGVTSQREIEKAARDAAAAGTLPESGQFGATMTLRIPELGLEHVIEHVVTVTGKEG